MGSKVCFPGWEVRAREKPSRNAKGLQHKVRKSCLTSREKQVPNDSLVFPASKPQAGQDSLQRSLESRLDLWELRIPQVSHLAVEIAGLHVSPHQVMHPTTHITVHPHLSTSPTSQPKNSTAGGSVRLRLLLGELRGRQTLPLAHHTVEVPSLNGVRTD